MATPRQLLSGIIFCWLIAMPSSSSATVVSSTASSRAYFVSFGSADSLLSSTTLQNPGDREDGASRNPFSLVQPESDLVATQRFAVDDGELVYGFEISGVVSEVASDVDGGPGSRFASAVASLGPSRFTIVFDPASEGEPDVMLMDFRFSGARAETTIAGDFGDYTATSTVSIQDGVIETRSGTTLLPDPGEFPPTGVDVGGDVSFVLLRVGGDIDEESRLQDHTGPLPGPESPLHGVGREWLRGPGPDRERHVRGHECLALHSRTHRRGAPADRPAARAIAAQPFGPIEPRGRLMQDTGSIGPGIDSLALVGSEMAGLPTPRGVRGGLSPGGA